MADPHDARHTRRWAIAAIVAAVLTLLLVALDVGMRWRGLVEMLWPTPVGRDVMLRWW